MSGRTLLSIALLVFGAALGAVAALQLRSSSTTATADGPGIDADLTERIASLEERMGRRVLPSGGEAAPPDDRVALLESRVDALEKGLDERIRVAAAEVTEESVEDFSRLTEDQLSLRAGILFRTRDYANAIRCYETMLGREIEEEARKTAMFQLGYCHRYVGDHPKAETVFKDIVNLRGPDTVDGRWATYQLGWSRYYQEDYRGALELMDDLWRKPDVEGNTGLWARYQAANFAVKVEEKGRARTILTSMIEELGDSEDAEVKRMLGYAESLLKSLNG